MDLDPPTSGTKGSSTTPSGKGPPEEPSSVPSRLDHPEGTSEVDLPLCPTLLSRTSHLHTLLSSTYTVSTM